MRSGKSNRLWDGIRAFAEKKRKNRTRATTVFSFVTLLLSLGILLTGITQAWIRRNWSSAVKEDNIRIETNGSLAFMLEGEEQSTITNAIPILEQFNLRNFVLKPVSNLSGKSEDFFTLIKNDADAEQYMHIVPPEAALARTTAAAGNGYIEFQFVIVGETTVQGTPEYTKGIYLKDDSYIEVHDDDAGEGVDPAKALRISITAGNTTYVFKNEADGDYGMTHEGVNNVTVNGVYLADGQDFWAEDGTEAVTFPCDPYVEDGVSKTERPLVLNYADVYGTVHRLSDFDGGLPTASSSGTVPSSGTGARQVDPDRFLCKLSSTSIRQSITVRIWLEGTDPCCEDAIAGMRIKLFLNFTAVNYDPATNLVIERTDFNTN